MLLAMTIWRPRLKGYEDRGIRSSFVICGCNNSICGRLEATSQVKRGMSTWKSPPKAKVYEALSAVADGRVTLMGGEKAEVVSSDGTKTYHVEWSPDSNQITSNDNASYWQGYLGYPIIAVLDGFGKTGLSD